jgi:hypothetical protein
MELDKSSSSDEIPNILASNKGSLVELRFEDELETSPVVLVKPPMSKAFKHRTQSVLIEESKLPKPPATARANMSSAKGFSSKTKLNTPLKSARNMQSAILQRESTSSL